MKHSHHTSPAPDHPPAGSAAPESCHASPGGHGRPPASAPDDAPVYMGMPHERILRPRFWVALALTLPVLALAMGEMVAPDAFHRLHAWNPHFSGWLQLLLTTPIFFWSGAYFNRRWWRSVRERDANMFTLTVTGTGAAYAYSVAAVLFADAWPDGLRGAHGVPLYFEAAAFITTVVLLGQILEQRAHARTDAAIRALMRLAPATAHRVRDDGTEEDVPLEAVRLGDRLRVRPGEHLPVDGVLLDGPAEIDESMLTGEPLPVSRQAGELVRAGTLNTTGSFALRAAHVGADTLLARIIRLVKQATESEAPIARLADRVSAWFIPAVLAIATVTFFAWGLSGATNGWLYGLLNAVAVLIIACPCALGLATPVSLVTGIGRGAQAGVLVKDAGALEALARATTVLIDKTGTLTAGRPAVVALRAPDGAPVADADARVWLRLAAAAEAGSEHPLARAIVDEAGRRGLDLAPAQGFQAQPGAGVSATVDGRRVDVGRAPAELTLADRPHATLVSVRIDGKQTGIIALEDPPKPTSREAVAALRAEGLRVVMVTGDRRAVAERLAADFGLDGVHADVTPEQKQLLVREHQARGETVVFAGDGLNDAPALAAADVGIAMGTGTDVAMHSAGLVLVKGDLAALVRAVHLARATLRNIKQNLFWAFCYNVAGLPLAAGALFPLTGWLLNPMFAGAAMSLSSISVVANALRLRRARL